MRTALLAALVIVGLSAAFSSAAPAVSRFPPPDFESDYQRPQTTYPPPRPGWQEATDAGVLLAALCVAAWLALKVRRRWAMVLLSIFSLGYFGFYREGCVCSVGAIQNVTLALADRTYALPLVVALFFALPLAFALIFGRVFCAGVCPLGAIQDLVLVRPVKVPTWLEKALSVAPVIYLGAAVLYAATGSLFIICRYDPFVGFFRLSGPAPMLIAGGIVLLGSMFIGRPYCRFLCPYRVLLGVCSRFAWRHATITPDECLVCSLCEDACPFGAIQRPTPEAAREES